MSQPLLSVIIPFQTKHRRTLAFQRLREMSLILPSQPLLEVIVGERVLSPKVSQRVAALCHSHGYRHVPFVAARGEPFSAAKARNVALTAACGEFVLFFDVDLDCGPGFWAELFQAVLRLRCGAPASFLMLPCLYLTKAGTRLWDSRDSSLERLRDSFVSRGCDRVHHLAICSSAVVLRREHALAVGAFREDFVGHGYEDFHLLHKLALAHPWGPFSADYVQDIASLVPAHLGGFRAYLARYALPHFFGNLLLVHRYHPIPHHTHYFGARQENAARFRAVTTASLASAPGCLSGESSEATELGFQQYLEQVLVENGVAQPRATGFFARDFPKQPWCERAFRKARKLVLTPQKFFADSLLMRRFVAPRSSGRW